MENCRKGEVVLAMLDTEKDGDSFGDQIRMTTEKLSSLSLRNGKIFQVTNQLLMRNNSEFHGCSGRKPRKLELGW